MLLFEHKVRIFNSWLDIYFLFEGENLEERTARKVALRPVNLEANR